MLLPNRNGFFFVSNECPARKYKIGIIKSSRKCSKGKPQEKIHQNAGKLTQNENFKTFSARLERKEERVVR